MVKAKKRFGQNFLQDSNIIHKIIAAINPRAEQHIIEIGPGQGALTEHLYDEDLHLDIIEIDRDLIVDLEQRFAQHHNCRLYPQDVLTLAFDTLVIDQEKLRIVGNLPYNISTPLLFHLIDYINVIDDMHFMLQKEVVDRIVAQPGSKTYGRLSVMMQYHFQVQALFTVSRHCFHPVPKVESAIIRMRPHQQLPHVADDLEQLETVIRLAFNQRRKTIRNSLKAVMDTQLFDSIDIDANLRAADLGLKDYVKISNLLSKKC